MASDDSFSRRNVLRATGSSMVGGAATGLAAADPGDQVEVNVGLSAERGRRAALDAASEVVREFDSLDAVTVRVPKRAVEALDGRSGVRYVEQNGRMRALCYSGCGYDRIDADVVCPQGETGSGVDIAIVDTGIDDDHPDLQANLGSGKAFVSCGNGGTYGNCAFSGNSNACNYAWSDDNDHGTHCAGIAAAVESGNCRVGVAPEATLHAVKVLDCAGSGSYSDIAAGIEYVADRGWDVANLSLGGSSGSSVLKDAVEYAYANGVSLVAAAGNDGPCTDCVGYPAAYSECIAVSSVNCTDTLSDFSSQGPEVEITAPGTDIYSTVPGGCDSFSGTSMATPFVTGAIALLRAEGHSNAEARQILKDTAETIGLGSNQSGAGLLDVAAALGYDSSDST